MARSPTRTVCPVRATSKLGPTRTGLDVHVDAHNAAEAMATAATLLAALGVPADDQPA